MRYWFTAAPNQPVVVRYDHAQHVVARRRLSDLTADILARRTPDDFELVADTESNRARLCRFCAYRSRCDRGVVAGAVEELDLLDEVETPSRGASTGLDFVLGDIDELSF
jgi:hypothetical protein